MDRDRLAGLDMGKASLVGLGHFDIIGPSAVGIGFVQFGNQGIHPLLDVGWLLPFWRNCHSNSSFVRSVPPATVPDPPG